MRLLFFGPQGAGKGTQAGLLSPHLGVPHISTGDLFHANVADDTPLGREAAAAVNAGELVPDVVTQGMLADRLRQPDAQAGFLLDGFPRNPAQADWLDHWLVGTPGLDAVVLLTAPVDLLIERALRRGRSDDTEESLRRRLAIYRESTQPLLDFYGPLVIPVDGVGPVELIHQQIVAKLASVNPVALAAGH
ncbi:adenylate kinase [Nakamurella leprariae]|uniref:Adenylate kinase n=1 Tax=Nakamurella leprariae TaxID=2803911 RepID=A0A938YEZ2_9ACTN|nr:adenylate kinase [Nakamurella leprariae]MBM9469472.1 adenylate kinase [Nakamurella leprariae]